MSNEPTDNVPPYYLCELITELEIIDAPEVATIVVKAPDYPIADLPALFDSTFHALYPALDQRGIQPIGPPFSAYYRVPGDTADLEVGSPVALAPSEEITADNGVVLMASTLPSGRVARISYVGGFDGLGEAWGSFMKAVEDSGNAPQFPFWEVYVSEPGPTVDPATLRTDLYLLLA